MKKQLIYHAHVETEQENRIAVKISTNDTNEICYLNRVSRDSLTLACDASTLNTLIPNKVCVVPNAPILLKANFALSQNIEASCRVVFTRRLSKDKFLLELKFVEISEQDMSNLDVFIEKALDSGKNKTSNQKPAELIAETKNIDLINSKNNKNFRKVA